MSSKEPPRSDEEQFNKKLGKVLKKNNVKGFDIPWVKRYLKEWYEKGVKGK
jgi:hypothetical protein